MLEESLRLAQLSQAHKQHVTAATQSYGVSTMSDVGSLAMETESQLSGLSVGVMTTDDAGLPHVAYDHMGERLEKQRRELDVQRARLERELEGKQLQLDEQLAASREHLQLQSDAILDRERLLKAESRSGIESVSVQTDYIEQLQHKQVSRL